MATKAVRWKDRVFEIVDRDALAKIASYEPPQQRGAQTISSDGLGGIANNGRPQAMVKLNS